MFNFNSESFLNRAKQFGKGALLFGTGVLGYFGFSAAFYGKNKNGGAREDELASLPSQLAREITPSRRAISGGYEFQINSGGSLPSVSGLNDGGFVVTWIDGNQYGNGSNIYGQRYNSAGKIVGSEFQVNTYAITYMVTVFDSPPVASLGANGFVVIWRGDGQDGNGKSICGQRYNSIGGTEGAEFQVNPYTTSSKYFPSVAGLSNGGFVITWMGDGQGDNNTGVYGQHYNSAGAKEGDEFLVNTYTTDAQSAPSVASLGSDGFVVTWSSDGYGIYGQRFNLEGAKEGNEFRVNTYYTDGSQGFPSVASLQGKTSINGFVVVWHGDGQIGSYYDIYGQCFNRAGEKKGGEFRVNTDDATDTILSIEHSPSVASLGTNGFVVIWMSYGINGHNDDFYDIYGQRYNSAGVREGNEFRVDTYPDGVQGYASVASLGTNSFVVVWGGDGYGDGSVYGRIFMLNGNFPYAYMIIGGAALLCCLITTTTIAAASTIGFFAVKKRCNKRLKIKNKQVTKENQESVELQKQEGILLLDSSVTLPNQRNLLDEQEQEEQRDETKTEKDVVEIDKATENNNVDDQTQKHIC